MSDEVPGYQVLLRMIFPPSPSGGRKHDLVERLTELLATKDKFFTLEEYVEFRSKFIGELAIRPRMPFSHQFVFLAFGIASLGGIIFAVIINVKELIWLMLFIIAICFLMWWGMERDYRRKRALSHSDRMDAVNDLLAAKLISPEEATDLRIKIQQL